jgi:iron complex transport system substrate-binding protein
VRNFLAFFAMILPVVSFAQAKPPFQHPMRIVTLIPSLGEIAGDIAGPELSRIVGVSDSTDYPPALKKVVSVASYARLNLEAIVALKPDLVLASADGNPKDQVNHLRELGLKVVVVRSASLADVEKSIETIGQAMGDTQSAQALLARFRAGEEQIRDHAKVRGLHPTVMLEISENPLIVAGRDTFLNEAIELVGAKNIFADLPGGYPRPSVEEAVHRDPDVIIITDLDTDSQWTQFPKMKAVAQGKVRTLQGNLLLRPSPRILQGIIALEHAIYKK